LRRFFNTHRDTDSFDVFVERLSDLINGRDREARVVISMREEFLGELWGGPFG
jgi:hypothetical protein